MEKRDLFDINKHVTGEDYYKDELIPPNRYILVVLSFIQNSKGQFLIQKTSTQKGGYYSSTGGHQKSGESSIQAMISEIQEEIGLSVSPNELQLIYEGREDTDRVFFDIYYLKKDFNISDLKLQIEEVESVYWLSMPEIEKIINQGLFIENHAQELYRVIDIFKNNGINIVQ